jgi:hypothetical protein
MVVLLKKGRLNVDAARRSTVDGRVRHGRPAQPLNKG